MYICIARNKKPKNMEIGTEQKIIEAARKIFTTKGYYATRTRDIAEESGINLSLINYYFRSKENLFRIIVEQQLKEQFVIMRPILTDTNITIVEKIKTIVNIYTDFLLANADFPAFIINELRTNKEIFHEIINNMATQTSSVISQQIKEANYSLSVPDLIINTLSMTIFPFITKDLFISADMIKEDEFEDFVISRKEKIIGWVLNMLNT